MALLVRYRCPECQGEFDFLHHPRDEPPPTECELCRADMTPQRTIPKINIGTAKNQVGDKLYRQMEKASADNAEAAAEIGGGDASDYAAVKITDMKDNQRAGDHAAMTRATAATQELTVRGSGAAPQMQNPQAAQWASETTAGPNALTTRKVMDSMPHANIVASTTARGNMGKY